MVGLNVDLLVHNEDKMPMGKGCTIERSSHPPVYLYRHLARDLSTISRLHGERLLRRSPPCVRDLQSVQPKKIKLTL